MTVEMSEGLRNKCIFVSDWECPIETSEIPLEVCKTCLKARTVHSKVVKINRRIVRETIPAQDEALLRTEVPQIVSAQ